MEWKDIQTAVFYGRVNGAGMATIDVIGVLRRKDRVIETCHLCPSPRGFVSTHINHWTIVGA